MIKTVEMYTVVCDKCGNEYTDEAGTGFTHWSDFGQALESADTDGWWTEEKHYCPKCHKIDENDNLVLNPTTEQDK